MSETLIVIQGSTDEIGTYPPTKALAQASEAGVRIGTSAVSIPDAYTSVTPDAVDATTSAASEKGDDSLTFALDPSATAGRLYLLSHASFQAFPVEVLSSGTTTRLARPLRRDVPSGATLKGLWLGTNLTTTQTAEIGPGVAHWRAVLDGVEHRWMQRFRVYPRSFANWLTPPELMRRAPEVTKLLDSADTTGMQAIAAAYEWLVEDLESQGFAVHRINTVEKLNGAVVRLILWRLYAAAQGPASEDTKEAKQEYLDARDKAIRGAEFWYDRTLDGSEQVPERRHEAQPGPRIVL